MKNISIAMLFLVCISLVVYFLFMQKNLIRDENLSTITIGSQKLTIEIANTPEKITRGLGERDTLGSDGMLFVLPERSIPSFWMKGMRFDLDFVWIDGNTVVDITENVSSQDGAPVSELEVYSPKVPITHVFEMNAGEVKKRGIKVGDAVLFPN